MSNTSKPLRVYFAAPLYNEMERKYNAHLSSILEPHFRVFLPQRDGKLMSGMLERGMPIDAAREAVFKADTSALRSCDLVLAVLDGRTVDEGVAFELGFGHALGKRCFGLKTDDRALLRTGDNPLIEECCEAIFGDASDLVERLTNMQRIASGRL